MVSRILVIMAFLASTPDAAFALTPSVEVECCKQLQARSERIAPWCKEQIQSVTPERCLAIIEGFERSARAWAERQRQFVPEPFDLHQPPLAPKGSGDVSK